MASSGNVMIIDDDDDNEPNHQQTENQMIKADDPLYAITRPNEPQNIQNDGDSGTKCIPAHFTRQLSTPLNIPKRLPHFGEHQTASHGASASRISETEEMSAVEDRLQKFQGNDVAPKRRERAGKPKWRRERPRSGCGFLGKDSNAPKFPFEVIEEMSAVNVTMLIIKGFGRKHRSSTVNINLDERNNRVTIEAQSMEELNTVQINMRGCLEQIRTRKRNVDKNVADFLATDPCRKCLRAKLKCKKIGAVIDAQEHSCELVGYAFTVNNLDTAFNVLDETLITRDIPLQTHDREAVNVSINKISQHKTELTGMFVSSTTVKLISFVEREVDEIETKIQNLMKDCKPKEERAIVELHNAKARCFNKHFSSGLQSAIRQRNGQYWPEQSGNDENIKVTITVIGESGLKDLLEQTVNKIWKERFDFAKVCTNADDKWLLVKGVSGKQGMTFLKHCEVTFDCFIEQFKEGTVQPPTGKSRVTVQPTEDSDTSSSSDDEMSPGAEADVDNENRQNRIVPARSIGSDTYIQLQGTCDYKVALARALQKSLESESGLNHPNNEARGLRQLRERSFPSLEFESPEYDDKGDRGYSDRMKKVVYLPQEDRKQQVQRPRHAYDKRDQGDNPSLMSTSSFSQNMNGMQIHVVKGDVTTEKADALVNMVSSNMDFGETTVSKAYQRAAGDALEQSYAAGRQHGRNINRVIVTQGCGKLICKIVIHVGLIVGKDRCKMCLSMLIPQILQECEKNRCQSIALIPLGLGRMYKYEADDCAEQTFLSLNQYHQTYGILKEVKIIVSDDKTLQVFTTALKSAAQSGTSSRVQLPSFQLPFQLPPQVARSCSPVTLQQPYMSRQQQLGLSKPFVQITGSRPSNPAVSSKPKAAQFQHKDGNSGQQARSDSSPNLQIDTRSTTRHYRSSRVKYQAVPGLNISVFAKDRPTCENALTEMGKTMKQDLLFEKKFERIHSLSKETKSEIAKVIDEHNIISIKEKDSFLLKGRRDGVLSAHSCIMEILLKNPRSSNTKRRTENTKRETLEFARVVAEEEPMAPNYWKHYQEGSTLANIILSVKHKIKGNDYEKVDIKPTSRTYSRIVRMVNETTDPSVIGKGKDANGLDPGRYSKLWVTQIQRIENLSLFRKYCHKRQSLFEQLVKQKKGAWLKVENSPKSTGPIVLQKLASRKMASDLHPEINEVLLFHGTTEDTIDTICQDGLDSRLGSGKAMFGPGVYGAEKALKADQYTDDPTSRTYGQGKVKKMFLMRMLLGQCFVCDDQNPTKYKRAPCCTCFSDVCKQHLQRFDSVIGDNQKLFREFVVYDNGQCYPEYLITYERR
ncbi:uncharacterized protein LOC127877306 isoform X2 [Dreissena polymorpha]|uniref:uncharacterized protein LOC127877306 isoform X2 n=1 Tax=Dreissena polymorpha TaxID=45954 RepID=UPI002264133B|nr:uncharacterized protein LOC127877306 isoform X2 [Dreissena polymorpha]